VWYVRLETDIVIIVKHSLIQDSCHELCVVATNLEYWGEFLWKCKTLGILSNIRENYFLFVVQISV